MSSTVKVVLTFAAAALAAAAAAGPAGMPQWAQIALAAATAGLAAIGIVPPKSHPAMRAATDVPDVPESPMMRGIKAQSMGEVYERGYEHGFTVGTKHASAAMNEQAELADILTQARRLLISYRSPDA